MWVLLTISQVDARKDKDDRCRRRRHEDDDGT